MLFLVCLSEAYFVPKHLDVNMGIRIVFWVIWVVNLGFNSLYVIRSLFLVKKMVIVVLKSNFFQRFQFNFYPSIESLDLQFVSCKEDGHCRPQIQFLPKVSV